MDAYTHTHDTIKKKISIAIRMLIVIRIVRLRVMTKIRKTITLTVIVNKVMALTIMIITATTIVVNNNSSSNQRKK